MREYAAGPGQLMVVYETTDASLTEGQGLSPEFLTRVSGDVGYRATQGWDLVCYETTPTLTVDSVLPGRAKLWDVAVTAVYRLRG